RARGPGAGGWHLRLGRALARAGRYADCEAALRGAVRLTPRDTVARANLATGLRRQRRPGDAEAIIREATESPSERRELASVLLEQRRYKEACAVYRETLRTYPDDARAWTGLARALERRGRMLEAANAYREAGRLAPGD